ncbi:MAG: PilZ domain-containing protein [Erythrobacter sp.]
MHLAEILDSDEAGERRVGPRREVRLITDCSLPGVALRRGLITDLSEQGMRLKTRARLPAGERIAFTLSGSFCVEGEVMWQRDIDHGIRFSTPLSRAELAIVVLSSCPEAPPAPHSRNVPVARNERRAPIPDAMPQPANQTLRDRDLVWIVPLAGLVMAWFLLVDAFFAIADRIDWRR